MKRHLTILSIALLLAFVFGFTIDASAGELQQKLAQESMIEQALERGKLRIGFSTFVPWAMKDKTGKYVGFEIDVATRLAQDLGMEPEWVPTKWDGIIPALLTGKFDVIIGGMTITPQRSLKVNFTDPYDLTGQMICAHKELAQGFASVEDFNRPDVIIALRIGTTAQMAAKKHMPKAQFRLFDDQASAYQELLNGKVHATVASLPMPVWKAIEYPDTLFNPIKETFTTEAIGMAIRKGDCDSLTVLNSWITVVRSEGWVQEKRDYWFGTMDWKPLIE
jgi:polar amino acid transport system substrate-binding protein